MPALPGPVVVPADGGLGAVTWLLATAMGRDAPGQDAVLDRLLDVALVSALRPGSATGSGRAWLVLASGDPVVGPALRLVHDRPAEPWSVASLAATVGVSRATLARRFAELVGEPPISYPTGWRIALAADLPANPSLSSAQRVGCASPVALSTAFKRVTGISPAAHRAAAS